MYASYDERTYCNASYDEGTYYMPVMMRGPSVRQCEGTQCMPVMRGPSVCQL